MARLEAPMAKVLKGLMAFLSMTLGMFLSAAVIPKPPARANLICNDLKGCTGSENCQFGSDSSCFITCSDGGTIQCPFAPPAP